MFERLGERLDEVLGRFRQRGVLTPDLLEEGLREVRRALLEADVNYRVVRDFLARVEERATGEEVLGSVRPGQQVVKIVHDELVELLGREERGLAEAPVPPTTVALVGLQGSGKTTTAAKLAAHLARSGGSPAVAACDPYRPAAAEQLRTLAEGIGVPVYGGGDGPEEASGDGEGGGEARERRSEALAAAAARAVEEARRDGRSHLVLDTAGRLQADEELMAELRALGDRIEPDEVLLVADAMTGQEAVRVAEGFHEAVGLTGVVLTKMDGDARGGAALSVRATVGVPVKFVGVGERPEDLTLFDPRRMAGRILQMGDVVGLVERAERSVDEETARRLEEKVRSGERFDLEDFLGLLRQLQRMGPLEGLLQMVPGVKPGALEGADVAPRRLRHLEAIVLSMTPEERRRPEVLDGSRRARIARGSGRPVHEVNRLLKQFRGMREMMKDLGEARSAGGGPAMLRRILG